MNKLNRLWVALLFCGLLFNACTNELDVQPTAHSQPQEENEYNSVGVDPNFNPETDPENGRTAEVNQITVNKIRVWLYRGSEATGTFHFRIRKVATGE